MVSVCFQLSAAIDDPHYWFVVLGPHKGKYFCANATDAKKNADHSCLLRGGCHPQITKESAISYKRSRLWSATTLEAELKRGVNFRIYAPCSPEIIKQILQGALASDLLPNEVLKWVAEAIEGTGHTE